MVAMFRFFLSFFLLLYFATGLFAEQGLICMVDHIVGFQSSGDSGSWKAQSYKLDIKYVITKNSDTYDLKYFGKTQPLCKSDKIADKTRIVFKCFHGHFLLNKDSGRFIKTYTYGYIEEINEGNQFPNLQIGRCSPF